MKTDQLKELRKHTEQLALALIREANPDGVIRTPNPDGTASPDVPATHHMIEVMATLDREIFADGILAALQWFSRAENGVSDHPFALGSIALAGAQSPECESAIRMGIADRQLGDGSIPVFTAYLPGGDYFSTLWSVKIMSQYSKELFESEVNAALDYLVHRREVGCSTASQLGFLGLLLAKNRPTDTDVIQEIADSLINALESRPGQEPVSLIDRLFILEDLLALDAVVAGCRVVVDRHLVDLFDLTKEAAEIPRPIAEARQRYSDSLFLETIARCAIVGIERCRAGNQRGLAFSVNRLVHSDYRNTRYKALRTSAGLRAFLERYGSIHEAFAVHNDKLEAIWEGTPFNKTVFLMMPFRPDLKFRKLTEVIKATCQQHGYTAIRVDDRDRRFSDRLWDNLIINMIASKHAVAVYVSEPVVDRLKKDEVRLFANPNVALEFGFFKSRGQEVLLLKDRGSELPSDLQGFLWSEFDIENPDTTVPMQIETWLEHIKESSGDLGS